MDNTINMIIPSTAIVRTSGDEGAPFESWSAACCIAGVGVLIKAGTIVVVGEIEKVESRLMMIFSANIFVRSLSPLQ